MNLTAPIVLPEMGHLCGAPLAVRIELSLQGSTIKCIVEVC